MNTHLSRLFFPDRCQEGSVRLFHNGLETSFPRNLFELGEVHPCPEARHADPPGSCRPRVGGPSGMTLHTLPSTDPAAGHPGPGPRTHWTPAGESDWTGPCRICCGQSTGIPPHTPRAARHCGSRSPGSQTASSSTPGGPWRC